MIRVKVCMDKDSIQMIEMCGHAQFAPHGEDLVCAGASSIAIGALNALDTLCTNKCLLEIDDGYIKIIVEEDSNTVQTVLQTLYIQLATMVESYKEYIEIMKEEV